MLTVPPNPAGRVALLPLLAEFGRRRWTNLLVEGGAGVLGGFVDAGQFDELHVFVAPKLLGGRESLTPVGGTGVAALADAQRFRPGELQQLDGDVYWRGWRGD